MAKNKQFTPAEKMKILRRYLIDHVPMSELCSQYQINPEMVESWQDRLFDRGAVAFSERSSRSDFVVSKSSKTIHRASCPWANNISPENRMVFDSLDPDLVDDYDLCTTCFTVKGKSHGDL